jgi:hypothetical protein
MLATTGMEEQKITEESDDVIFIKEIKNPTATIDHIKSLFYMNVAFKKIDLTGYSEKHCGKEGHWLESKFNVQHNSKNQPDILGFELKKWSKKTTLGDFSASEYAFSKERTRIDDVNGWNNDIQMTRTQFIRYFGNPNPKKNNRYSWSGTSVPTFGKWNSNGQLLCVTDNKDIVIYYCYDRDCRARKIDLPEFVKVGSRRKATLLPSSTEATELTPSFEHQTVNSVASVEDGRVPQLIMIAIWEMSKMKSHIDNKFNKKGFVICKKTRDVYDQICFGKPFDFEYFMECFQSQKIKFDSGMVESSTRNYSSFRANSKFWDQLSCDFKY